MPKLKKNNKLQKKFMWLTGYFCIIGNKSMHIPLVVDFSILSVGPAHMCNTAENFPIIDMVKFLIRDETTGCIK